MGKSPGASRIPAGPRETSGGEQRACRRGDPLYAEKAEITPTEREMEREREREREGEKKMTIIIGREEAASCPLPGAVPPRCCGSGAGAERGAPAAAAPSPCAARRAGDKSDFPCVPGPGPLLPPPLSGSASPPQGQGSAAGPGSATDQRKGGVCVRERGGGGVRLGGLLGCVGFLVGFWFLLASSPNNNGMEQQSCSRGWEEEEEEDASVRHCRRGGRFTARSRSCLSPAPRS